MLVRELLSLARLKLDEKIASGSSGGTYLDAASSALAVLEDHGDFLGMQSDEALKSALQNIADADDDLDAALAAIGVMDADQILAAGKAGDATLDADTKARKKAAEEWREMAAEIGSVGAGMLIQILKAAILAV